MTDIPEAILSKAREIYEGAWPDPVSAIAEAIMEASMPVWQKVPEEPTLELLKSINIDNQVLVYENGRYYNAWFEFEPSEGGWLWTDENDSEPNPSHYMPLPKPPEGPVDITDIAQAAHPIIDAGNALIQHLKGKSA